MRKRAISLYFLAISRQKCPNASKLWHFPNNLCFSSRKPNSLDAINYIERLPKKLPAFPLKPLPESEQILDFDDKFGLANVTDAREILKHLKLTNFSYNFNDLRYFLKRLQEIHEDSQGAGFPKHDSAFKALISEVKSRLPQENCPFLGTFAYCFRHLDVQDRELWLLCEEKVRNDEYYVNFKEIFRLCEGLVKFVEIFKGKPERVDFLYERVERNLDLTLWHTNMLYYQRISEALVQAGRGNSRLFEKLEELVLSNLGMEYDVETFSRILLSFGRVGRGSRGFYEVGQRILANGHPMAPALVRKPETFGHDGEKIAEIVEIFAKIRGKFSNYQGNAGDFFGSSLVNTGNSLNSLVNTRNSFNSLVNTGNTLENTHNLRINLGKSFEFEPDFLVHMFSLMENHKTTFSLKSATKILEFLEFFEYEEEDRLFRVVFAKIDSLQRVSAREVVDFLKLAQEKQKLKEISRKTRDFLEISLLNALKSEKFEHLLGVFKEFKETALFFEEKRWNSLISQLLRENVANLPIFVEESRKSPEIYADLQDFSQFPEGLLEFKENLSRETQ